MKDMVPEKKAQKNSLNLISLRNEALMWILLIPTVLAIILCHWNPILRGMITSLFRTKGFKIIEFVGLTNYKNVINDTMFLTTLLNTFKYVAWSLVIGVLPPLVLAIVINEIIYGKQMFKVFIYLPAVAPALAASVIWMNMYSPSPGGLMNTILSGMGLPMSQWLLNEKLTIPLIIISMTWKGYGATMLLYLSELQSLSQDLYEAAVIDGAGIFRRLKNVTFPHLKPIMLLMIIQQIIGVFQIFDQPLVMTDGGPNNASLSLGLTSYKLAFSYMQVDRSMALGTVSFFILIIATLFYFRAEKKLER